MLLSVMPDMATLASVTIILAKLSSFHLETFYSFFGQSLSRGHYQPPYQPSEGVFLLSIPIENCDLGPHGTNFQSLLGKSTWFGGNKEDTLSAENNDKGFISYHQILFLKITLTNWLLCLKPSIRIPQTARREGKVAINQSINQSTLFNEGAT